MLLMRDLPNRIARVFVYLLRRVELLLGTLFVVRGAVIAYLIGIALGQTSQVQEVVRIDAAAIPALGSEKWHSLFGPYAYSFLAVVLAALFLYLFARLATLVELDGANARDRSDGLGVLRDRVLVALPILLGSSYLFGYLYVVTGSLSTSGWLAWLANWIIWAVLCMHGIWLLAILLFYRDQEFEPLDAHMVRALFLEPADHAAQPAPSAPDQANRPPDGLARASNWLLAHASVPGGATGIRTIGDVLEILFKVFKALVFLVTISVAACRALMRSASDRPFGPLRERYYPKGATLDDTFRNLAHQVLARGAAEGQPDVRSRLLAFPLPDPVGPWLIAVGAFVILTAAMSLWFKPALLLLSPVVLMTPWTDSAAQFGAIAILQVFVIYLAAMFAIPRVRPVAIAFLIALLVLSWRDWHDTHFVTPLSGAPSASRQLGSSFEQWLAARPDHKAYRDQHRPYPVYIVAARGGGIYAAYHTATFLARMQDLCPDFPTHLFAASSVSGGSVGAATYAGLVAINAPAPQDHGCLEAALKALPANDAPGPLERQARDILAADLLSPAVGAMLFTDPVAQLLPTCPSAPGLLCGHDRARSLEQALERSFEQVTGRDAATDPLQASVYAQWKPQGSTPALLINTTEVETGAPIVIAPFSVRAGDQAGLRATLQSRARDLDLRLSTAAFISARFPYISPAASYLDERDASHPVKHRLVDGGYFDNSGISTALDVIAAVHAVHPDQDVQVNLVVLAGAPTNQSGAAGSVFLSEILAPMRALGNIRAEQGRRTAEFAEKQLGSSAKDGSAHLLFDRLDEDALHLPLGWRLGDASRTAIQSHVGWPGQACIPGSNACTLQTLVRELSY